MKKIWGSGIIATLLCGVGLMQFACSSTASVPTPAVVGDPKIEELIGSVPVTSASLDGIGSIGFVYDYGGGNTAGAGGAIAAGASNAGAPAVFASGGTGNIGEVPSAAGGSTPFPSSFSAQCTGTLVSKSSVLTSRSCAQLLQPGYSGVTLKFAIGADSTQPKRLIDVVDVEFAPLASDGSSYPDIAVLHLGESVTDVASFPVAVLSDDLLDEQLAAVGFGNSDLRYQTGARRAGALTVRATSGLLYPAIFGGFEAFYQYSLNGGYPYGTLLGTGGAALGTGGAVSSAGSNPSPSGSGGAPVGDDWYRQYLQQQYDSVALASGEAYLGGSDADAQPCGADQGGPAVRKQQNKVRVLGVFSRTPFGTCDKGAIYAGITADTKAFIDTAAQWKDPCTGIAGNGSCVGTTATRCSTIAEGKRRAVKFDCSLLNQVCVGGGNTEVACTDK